MLILDHRHESGALSLAAARSLLADPSPKDATMAVLGSAAFCAACALGLATAVILGAAMPDHDAKPTPVRAYSGSGAWSR